MNILKNKYKQVTQNKIIFKLINRINFANLMELPEKEFRDYVREVENSELFKKLLYSKAIRLQRFSDRSLSSYFYELKEDFFPDKTSLDIESILSDKKQVIQIIKNLGYDRFKKYFLDNESIPDSKIISECNLSIEEIKKIRELVDDLRVQNEFFQYSNPTENKISRIYYTKIASIVKDNGNYTIVYLNANLYRRKYIIDYKKIKELKENGYFTEEEIKKLQELVRNLELINNRKQVLQRILENIIKYQNKYLDSGNPLDLKPLTLRELGRKINISPSHISRVIRYKSVETPWGEEKPLKYFFPNKKKVIKEYIREIIKDGIDSDQSLREKIAKRLNIYISRRSVCDYRREVVFATSCRRKND
jgi:DNA-directed RNA polymerase specialized sigma54-like protein